MEALNALSFKEQFIYMAIPVSVTVVFLAILLNAMEFDKGSEVVWYKKSIVETGSMTLFAVLCFGAYRLRIGQVVLNDIWKIAGAGIVYFSLLVNLLGRYYLKSNWSNQIRVKSKHSLVSGGPYKFVRHPLYTSTITMIYGAGLIYGNYAVLVLNTVIFIPMMVLRASQEEKALCEHLNGYEEYQDRVPMLMPFGRSLVMLTRKMKEQNKNGEGK